MTAAKACRTTDRTSSTRRRVGSFVGFVVRGECLAQAKLFGDDPTGLRPAESPRFARHRELRPASLRSAEAEGLRDDPTGLRPAESPCFARHRELRPASLRSAEAEGLRDDPTGL